MLAIASWTASEEDLRHSREALQGPRMAGITLQAAGNLAMTLCQAPWGWQAPRCSPSRAQRNGGLRCDLAQGAGNHAVILCGLEGGRGCSIGTHKDKGIVAEDRAASHSAALQGSSGTCRLLAMVPSSCLMPSMASTHCRSTTLAVPWTIPQAGVHTGFFQLQGQRAAELPPRNTQNASKPPKELILRIPFLFCVCLTVSLLFLSLSQSHPAFLLSGLNVPCPLWIMALSPSHRASALAQLLLTLTLTWVLASIHLQDPRNRRERQCQCHRGNLDPNPTTLSRATLLSHGSSSSKEAHNELCARTRGTRWCSWLSRKVFGASLCR